MDDKDKPNGKIIKFPDGKSISSNDIGTDFVVDQGNHIPTPELLDPAALDKETRDRESYVKRQELVSAADRKASTSEIIDIILKEISEELAHLKFERRKATKEGKNTALYTTSRIASLRQLADILQKRQENARAERLDVRSPEFKKILRAWMVFVYESMNKVGINEGTVDSVFKQMEADMIDWEKSIIDLTG